MSVLAPALWAGPFRPWRLFAVGQRPRLRSAAFAQVTTLVQEAPDPRRFRELMLPHLDAAYTLARYLTRDASTADDVVQDAYLRAFKAFGGYRGGEPKAWLLAIVRNCAFSAGRADRSRGAVFADGGDPTALETAPDTEQESAEAALVRSGDVAAVRAAVSNLPEPFRETLVLREFDELSYKEIAAVTSAPIGTVMSRLARARALLAEALGDVVVGAAR